MDIQEEENPNTPFIIRYVQGLYKKHKILKMLSDTEKDYFQQQILQLLVKENGEEIDQAKYNKIVNKIGIEAFILEILSDVMKSRDENNMNTKKLEKDLADISRIFQQKQVELNKKDKRLQQKEAKLKSIELNMTTILKNQVEKHQKEVIELLSKKQAQIAKRVGNHIRNLKLKEDILKEKISELKLLESKKESLQGTDRKLKDRAKLLDKKDEDLKRKQLDSQKETNELKLELSKLKTKVQELNKKITTLELNVSAKKKELQKKDSQIQELKHEILILNQKSNSEIQRLRQNLQNRTIELQNCEKIISIKRIQQQPFNEIQLNISQIQQNQLMSGFVEEKQQPNLQQVQAINILLQNFTPEIVRNTVLKKLISNLVGNVQIQKSQYCNIFKICLRWILNEHNSQFYSRFNHIEVFEDYPMHMILIVLFTSADSQIQYHCLNCLQLYEDHEKMELTGYLEQLIDRIGIAQIFNQKINNGLIELILRLIQQSSNYQYIIAYLSKPFFIEYFQNIFEKYEMENEIIENVSVVLSRLMMTNKGKIKLKESFIKRIRLKIKTVNTELTTMNLQSILDNN